MNRAEEDKRQKDLKFLERLKVATLKELQEMLVNHAAAPEWKYTAILRAIRKLE